MTVENLRQRYVDANQDHLFDHFDKLSDEDKTLFTQNLSKVADRIPPKKLVEDCKHAIKLSSDISREGSSIEPLPSSSYESIIGNPEKEQEYYNIGLDAIARGQAAVILMAGGQGTRLGSSEPKGCYDIQLPSHKSLFQIQAEKLISLQKLANNVVIPWYIMTSEPTRASTESFFVKHNYFGLLQSQIVFFNQGTLPAFDINGERLLLGSPTKLVESPDGNGGLYCSLRDNGILTDMINKGVKHVYMYCVDNVLSKVCDPVFIGFSIKHSFELATKAVRKRDAHESVGLIASKDNRPCVIEYSEISKELAEAQDANGLLKLRAGNIVNHYYSIDLLKRELDNWCNNMVYHIAKKKIPSFDNKKNIYYQPVEPNGIKLEQFIFDVFPTISLSKFGCLEVERSEEFAPLKNAPGTSNDNPETSRAAYLNLSKKWLTAAGAHVGEGVNIEVSGTLTYAGENLSRFKNQNFNSDILLE
ncbi:hypothetical protein KAFR_0K02470 [Kazachstania africana CBS 2517]|uniref:UDP-N-acetylglucosamine diphosphorylase n=1 Tax=Kazachstania africana (strain ATCC 22294 / BCRC 22015 / CBS 2517 / CECT 1963 / NBRC 1671 / NRRL Y-8276) TaxID=1071382 RepID=H2B1V3_KAZAF|nr:hypothetical protein KAFR_0K02470 [Kazachstania africana CBS 2517]CCF60603.1 hypothetical protein KAFR_0K02470 [Kazachstania africana CBS 2517]